MTNSESLHRMVDEQIVRRGLNDPRVIEAMKKIDRRKFVTEADSSSAYKDRPLAIGLKQTISQPYIVALMTHELSIEKTHRVLEIGTGSGYQTAILAELADQVFTVEIINSLSISAEQCLIAQGYSNIDYAVKDGSKGWVEESPFDSIIVTAASPGIPNLLIEQLKIGGRLVIPVGTRQSQELKVVIKEKEDNLKILNRGRCIFVPLVGAEWYLD